MRTPVYVPMTLGLLVSSDTLNVALGILSVYFLHHKLSHLISLWFISFQPDPRALPPSSWIIIIYPGGLATHIVRKNFWFALSELAKIWTEMLLVGLGMELQFNLELGHHEPWAQLNFPSGVGNIILAYSVKYEMRDLVVCGGQLQHSELLRSNS